MSFYERNILYIFCNICEIISRKNTLIKKEKKKKGNSMNNRADCTKKKYQKAVAAIDLFLFFLIFRINDRSETLPNMLICVTRHSLTTDVFIASMDPFQKQKKYIRERLKLVRIRFFFFTQSFSLTFSKHLHFLFLYTLNPFQIPFCILLKQWLNFI